MGRKSRIKSNKTNHFLLLQVRESDETDPHRERTVQLLDDFKISGVNGTRILHKLYNTVFNLISAMCITVSKFYPTVNLSTQKEDKIVFQDRLLLNAIQKYCRTFNANYCLMQVKSIAECSKRAFCNTFDLH